MPEDHLKPQNGSTSSSSSSSGSGDATSGSGEDTLPVTTAAPIDNMTNGAPVAPMDTGGTGEGTGGQQAEGRGRDLGEKGLEQKIQKTPEELRQEDIQRKLDVATAKFQLTPVEAANLEKEAKMPGVDVSPEFIKKQVQNIAPDKLVMAEFREKFGATMAHVAEAGLSYLAPPAANFAKQQQASPTLTA